MSLRDIKMIEVWERKKERGAFSVKIVCNSQEGDARFNKTPYKFFRGERGIRQAATRVLIRQRDLSVFRKICKMINRAKREKRKIEWDNPLFPNEDDIHSLSFFQRIAVEYEEDLRKLQLMYEKNGSC